jgi:hypothetical protein
MPLTCAGYVSPNEDGLRRLNVLRSDALPWLWYFGQVNGAFVAIALAALVLSCWSPLMFASPHSIVHLDRTGRGNEPARILQKP